MTIRLQRERFRRRRGSDGACARAPGRRRGGDLHRHLPGDQRGEPIIALTLEHYAGMADAEIARHVEEAERRWSLLGVTVIHRHGRLAPGDNIVLVVTASSHRSDAFAAAEFLMDYLKTRAPFWKQVEQRGASTWVEAKDADNDAAARWAAPPHRRDAAE